MFASLRPPRQALQSSPPPPSCQALLFLNFSAPPPGPNPTGQPWKLSGVTFLHLENKRSPVLYCPIWGEPARAGVGEGAGMRGLGFSGAAESVLWGSLRGV